MAEHSRLQLRLIMTGGRLVKHARYYRLLLAEGHLTRGRFRLDVAANMLLSIPAGTKVDRHSVSFPAAELACKAARGEYKLAG